jgi:hypothetical protein
LQRDHHVEQVPHVHGGLDCRRGSGGCRAPIAGWRWWACLSGRLPSGGGTVPRLPPVVRLVMVTPHGGSGNTQGRESGGTGGAAGRHVAPAGTDGSGAATANGIGRPGSGLREGLSRLACRIRRSVNGSCSCRAGGAGGRAGGTAAERAVPAGGRAGQLQSECEAIRRPCIRASLQKPQPRRLDATFCRASFGTRTPFTVAVISANGKLDFGRSVAFEAPRGSYGC